MVDEPKADLINKDNQVLAEGTARYIKLSLNDIDNNTHEESDINVLVEDDVKEIDINVNFFS